MGKLKKIKIPSLEKCEFLIKKYKMPENIKAHTKKVREIANFIAKKISENNFNVDLILVDRSALMHDLMKMHCIANNCRHAKEAESVLSKEGFSEFGKILRLHGLDEVLEFDEKTPIEAKIVWYADKRVNHAEKVSLKERYEYLKETYGKRNEQKMKEIISTEKPALKIEKELLEKSGLDFI